MDKREKLNKEQKRAVLSTEGPLLIIAGAGTGKTKVITHRIAHLINKNIDPKKILAVTFTNKAATEMKERVNRIVGKKEAPTIETFHALSADILREHGEEVGISKNFSVLDEKKQQETIKSAIENLSLDLRQYPVSIIQNIISKKKSRIDENSEYQLRKSSQNEKIILVEETYEKLLRKGNALDFDDLIAKTAFLFRKNKEILNRYQNKWQYIHIDEYQDTDNVQFHIINMLGSKKNNICAVGDEDQSIYGFRGADFTNILNFEKTWPNAKIVTLEKNYRSTKKILNAANKIISRNTLRKQKNLFTNKKDGEEIVAFEANNENEEANFIAGEIEKILKKNDIDSSIAILCRTRMQFLAIEKALIEHKLPFKTLLSQDQNNEEKQVLIWLMTIHAAKGLEFKYVFIPGLEKGLFPYSNSDNEEERRIFYVALTRAQEKIYLSWCKFRTSFGSKQINQVSQFLTDIPKELIKWIK